MPELVYGSTFEKGTFSLIELNSPELVEAFEAGTNIVIKGLPEDEAVLCTDTKTYNVRQVSTSNTMLLTLPVSTQGVMTVLDELSSTIELLPCVPGLQRIDTLLEETRYAGEQQEAHLSDKAFYSYEALLSLVQASEAELKRGLEERGAFELKGYYRLLDQAHLHHLFDTFVNHCVLRELNVRAMTLKEAQECIRHVMSLEDDYCTGIPEEVELAFLRSFTTDASFSSYQDGVSFDETRVCRFLGNLLLKSERVRSTDTSTVLYSDSLHSTLL
ncbi:sister chromatid cohesion protein Dcc1 [Spinellus fusiger]|nr:sister chromatid cohesion protein Dcc1 [Spinellus fusiger]